MTYYLLIAFCIIIILSYIFEITGKFSKIPGVILLIITGIVIKYLLVYFNFKIPNFSNVLPFLGTLGLILIVLEGSLDLSLSRDKNKVIVSSILSAIILFVLFTGIFGYILIYFYQFPIKASLLNAIPFGVISSAVAIPSSSRLVNSEKEFIVYESSISDIVGILVFDFVLINSRVTIGNNIFVLILELFLTVIISILFSTGLAFILHKITHHVKYVIIMTTIVLIYALAKLIHMPSLLVVLIFGLVMNNNHFFNNKFSQKFIDFNDFNADLKSFKHLTGELTFIIRSFFFITFGFYLDIADLFSLNTLLLSLIISASIFIIRAFFFRVVLHLPLNPLLYFAPRGLITILLFLSIPANLLLPFMNKGVITQVIFITILIMALGNIFFQKVDQTLKVHDKNLNNSNELNNVNELQN